VDIIKSVGISTANYYRLKATDNHYPTLDHCVVLCEKYNVSCSWLLLNKGPFRSSFYNGAKPEDLIKQALVLMDKKAMTKILTKTK
jgi:hypothetical protein